MKPFIIAGQKLPIQVESKIRHGISLLKKMEMVGTSLLKKTLL